jgi:hypothetical protein
LELDTSNDLSAGGSFEQYDTSFDSGGSPTQDYSNRRGNVDIGAIGNVGLGLGLDDLDIDNPEEDSSSEDGSMVVGNGFNEDYGNPDSPNRDYYDNTGSGGSPPMYGRYQNN